MIFEEKTKCSRLVYEGPVFKVRQHVVETVGGDSLRDIIEHSGGSIMVGVTDEGRIIMVKQYRKALESEFLELPAGKTDPGEDPLVTATREFREETGYTAGSVKHLISFYPTCGYSNEYLHIFLCRDLVPGETHLDDTECIELLEYDADELVEMVMSGEIKDSKAIIGILYARMAGEI